jgi:hypothetical protein
MKLNSKTSIENKVMINSHNQINIFTSEYNLNLTIRSINLQ